MNKKVFIVGWILFLLGIFISQWTLFGLVVGIGGGIVMGLSSFRKQQAF